MNLAEALEALEQCHAKNLELVNDVLANQRDAERYRWLREELNIEWLADMLVIEEIVTPADIDAAIDREMGE